MFDIFTVIRFPAELLHVRNQIPVARDLKEAPLERDAQPRDAKRRQQVFTAAVA